MFPPYDIDTATAVSPGITTLTSSTGIPVRAVPVKRRSRRLYLLLGGILVATIVLVTTSVYFSGRNRSDVQDTNGEESSFTNSRSQDYSLDEDESDTSQTDFPEQTETPTEGQTTEFTDPPTEEETTFDDIEDSMSPITDLQAFVGGELATGNTYIVIPPGRHFVEPQARNGRVHLLLEDLVDVTIDGSQAELVCTKTTRAIEIQNCTNLSLIGLDIDYDPLPFSQGVISEISDDFLQLTIDMMEGYPNATTLDHDKMEIYSPEDDKLSTPTYYGITWEVDESDDHKVVVQKKPYHATISQESVGDIAVIASTNLENAITHAIYANNCTNLRMEDVRLFASPKFGFFETDCNGSHYVNCVVNRRGESWDPSGPREYRRLRSTNADGFHSKHAQKGPSYVGCKAKFMGDDGIAINGHYHIIAEAKRDNALGQTVLKVIGKMGDLPNLQVGDDAELVGYYGMRHPNAKIIAFDTEHGVDLTDEEATFLQAQQLSGNVANTRSATRAFHVTLQGAMNLPMGSLIASSNRVGNGFEVKNCQIGPSRSRGMVIKASDGEVSGNTVKDTWMHAMMFAPVYGWLESGSGNDLVITDNTIRLSHNVAIAVYAYGGNGALAPAGAHNNVEVSNNLITGSSRPAIAVTSTTGLILKENVVKGMRNDFLSASDANEWGRNTDPTREVYTRNVEMVV